MASPFPPSARMVGPVTIAELLEVAGGWLPGPRVASPVEIEGAAEADEVKQLLTLALRDPERQLPRRWSPWKQHCPVSLCDKKLLPGSKEFAVDFAGRIFMFATLAALRRFCAWPEPFLLQLPRINEVGMNLGYAMLSPCNYRLAALASRMQSEYGFDVVNLTSIIEKAMAGPDADPKEPSPPPPPAAGVDGEGETEEVPVPEVVEEEFTGPRLFAAEKSLLNAGKELSQDTVLRLVGAALGIEENIAIVKEQQEAIAKAKRELEAAAEAEQDPPDHIEVGEDGEPVVALSRPLFKPTRGFIMVGYPETAEQYQTLQTYLHLAFERIIIFKKAEDEEDAPEVAELLAQQGFDDGVPMELTMEAYTTNIDELVALEGVEVLEVPIHAEEHQQFVHVRKAIDPFYPVVEDPSSAVDIPDPDSFDPEEANPPRDPDPDEEEEELEPIERPVIPWSVTGMYCPVTLAEDRWLFPGSKEYQCVMDDRVFALGSEQCYNAFLAEPVKYLPAGEPALPPPRILLIGPTGSGLQRQCSLLAAAHGVPVLQLERVWRQEVERRLEEQRAKVKADAAAERLREDPMLDDEGGPIWPEDWVPPPEKTEEDEEAGEEEEQPPEPEEDGLDDEGREALFVEAMRSVLGAHCGACVIDGTFFSDLDDEEMSDEVKASRSLQNLLIKARRIPDLVISIRCKHDTAVKAMLDLDAIDKEHARRVAEYQQLVEEAEANEEDPPDQPEDLIIDDEDSEEKESDRARAKFVERKKMEQDLLKELVDALTEARAQVCKVPADRGEEAAHQGVRWHCRPFLEQRLSLLARQQVLPLKPSRATDLLQRTLARPSKFGEASPVNIDAPLFAGRQDALVNAVEFRGRIYYFRNSEDKDKFFTQPLDFIHGYAPSPVPIHPAVAVIGPPLAGKTTFAKRLADELGAVLVSLPEVITGVCKSAALQPDSPLLEVLSCMQQGKSLTDDQLAQVLKHRLTEADIMSRGWVLDNFPLMVSQAEALHAAGILPHRLFVLETPEETCMARLTARSSGVTESAPDLHLFQVDLQKPRFASYASRAPPLRAYYREVFGNEAVIDGTRSDWANFDKAFGEACQAVSVRLRYHRRVAEGKAVGVFGMCMTAEHMQTNASPWRRYCTVRLTLGNELVVVNDERWAVEYQTKMYWLSSEANMHLFLDDPEAFLQVPLPKNLPETIDQSDPARSAMKTLESYCPVSLVDQKSLVKVEENDFVVRYQGLYWAFSSKEALDKFMLRPLRYVQKAKLPAKKPPVKGEQNPALLAAIAKGKDLEPAEMLTYMQASVAEAVCQALVETGERRPICPGKSVEESILLFMARFLRARNPHNPEIYGNTVSEEYERFLDDCDLPEQVKELILSRQAEETSDGKWMASNARAYTELCDRFDTVFGLEFT